MPFWIGRLGKRLRGPVKVVALLLAALAWLAGLNYLWWQPRHLTPRATLPGTKGRHIGSFSPDSKTLAVSDTAARTCQLWDVPTGTHRATIPLTWPTFDIEFSPDGRSLAGPEESGLGLWDIVTGSRGAMIKDATTPFLFSPDGTLLAGRVPSNGGIKLWDPRTGEERATVRAKGNGERFCFSPDGRFLVVQSRQVRDSVALWDVASKRVHGVFQGDFDTLAFTTDGSTLALANSDDAALYDVASRKRMATIPGGHGGFPGAPLAFSPDDRTLAFFTGPPKYSGLQLWDVAANKVRADVSWDCLPGSLLYSPDGRFLVSEPYRLLQGPYWLSGPSVVWDTRARPPMARFGSYALTPSIVAFTADSRAMLLQAMWCPYEDLEASDGSNVPMSRPPSAFEEWWQKARNWLAPPKTGSNGPWPEKLQVVGLPGCRVYAVIDGCDVWLLSPDGKTVATKSYQPWNSGVQLWDVPSPMPFEAKLTLTLLPLLLPALWIGRRIRQRKRMKRLLHTEQLGPASPAGSPLGTPSTAEI